jgi:hypothetical protein
MVNVTMASEVLLALVSGKGTIAFVATNFDDFRFPLVTGALIAVFGFGPGFFRATVFVWATDDLGFGPGLPFRVFGVLSSELCFFGRPGLRLLTPSFDSTAADCVFGFLPRFFFSSAGASAAFVFAKFSTILCVTIRGLEVSLTAIAVL